MYTVHVRFMCIKTQVRKVHEIELYMTTSVETANFTRVYTEYIGERLHKNSSEKSASIGRIDEVDNTY